MCFILCFSLLLYNSFTIIIVRVNPFDDCAPTVKSTAWTLNGSANVNTNTKRTSYSSRRRWNCTSLKLLVWFLNERKKQKGPTTLIVVVVTETCFWDRIAYRISWEIWQFFFVRFHIFGGCISSDKSLRPLESNSIPSIKPNNANITDHETSNRI